MAIARRLQPPQQGMRALATALAVALAVAPIHAAAGVEPGDEVQQLYLQGQEQYDAGDFSGAAASWISALDKLPENERNRSTRELLVVQQASASLDAYEKSNDVGDLRCGKEAMDKFVDTLAAVYGSATLSAAVQEARTKLDEAVKKADSSGAVVAPVPAPAPSSWDEVDPPPQPAAEPEPQAEPTEPVAPNPAPAPAPATPPVDRPPPSGAGKGLTAGGAVFMILGVGGLAMMAAGLGLGNKAEKDFENKTTGSGRVDADDRGKRANNLAIAGGVIGPVFLIVGIGLLAGGAKRRRQARTALAPVIGPTMAGLTLERRF